MGDESEYPYDFLEQLSLLLKALDAILPFAERGGIETKYADAYDEWETIVGALFNSFLVEPLVNTNSELGATEFAKLGFRYQDDKERTRFLLVVNGVQYLLYDIGLAANGHYKLLVFSHDSPENRTLAIGADDLSKTAKVQIVLTKVDAPNFPMKF